MMLKTNPEKLFWDNKEAKVIQINSELRSIMIGDSIITEYYTRIKVMDDLLENIDSTVPEKNQVIYMINRMSPKFDHIANLYNTIHLFQPSLKRALWSSSRRAGYGIFNHLT